MSNEIVSEIVAAQAETQEDTAQATPETQAAPNDIAEQAPQEDLNFSSRFAALSRKEKSLQEQRSAFKDQQVEFDKMSDLKEQIKSNPGAVLDHYGISLDDLITAALGDDVPTPTMESQVDALRKEIESYKTEQVTKEEDSKKAVEEAEQNRINEAVSAHQLKITDLISQNVDKYELINLQGKQDLVWEVTEAHYDANGEVLTPDQAADKVEQYLEGEIRKAMNLARFNKAPEINSAMEAIKESIAEPVHKPQSSQTLTSDFVTQSAPKSEQKYVDAEESKRRAASLIKWNT